MNNLIPIIYASTSGNVEATCQHISDLLREAGFETSLHRAEIVDFKVIQESSVILLATSTWEHGEINPFFNNILGEIEKNDLTGKSAGFIGLGDTRYEQVLFCKGIDILREAFIKAGGKDLSSPLKINGEPYQYFNTTVLNWTNKLIELLKNESA
ncbi:flavodoxin domain-containing protein [Candidatus Dojkabacteria bacterium]|uniref:Flavodoxin domain-containing protein n=1 Tax=Candidatus Dojkabacteria bacterium TaxID=2099670 RepID=A0A955I5Y9_9BACT|nr:flavodoxin domain-containing protein [Candidatus Dojkabacteria bacterium]